MEETQHALLLFRATTTRAPRSGGIAKWGCQACTHLAGALLADEAGCDGQRKPVVPRTFVGRIEHAEDERLSAVSGIAAPGWRRAIARRFRLAGFGDNLTERAVINGRDVDVLVEHAEHERRLTSEALGSRHRS